jgi:hypothetical protein
MAGNRWEKHEEDFIRENFTEMSCGEMAEKLGRTTRSVQHKYNQMGLERPIPQPGVYKNNRLLLISTREEETETQKRTIGIFKCECGKITEQRLTSVVQGTIKSCGCFKNELAAERCKTLSYKHGDSAANSRVFRIWCAMNARCYTKSVRGFHNWGGRGITVCDEWRKDYLTFKKWALENGYSDELSIDRKEQDGNYCPENCKWSTREEQGNNQRTNKLITAFGEMKTATRWTRDHRCKCNLNTLIYRVFQSKNKWNSEIAIQTPPLKNNRCYGQPK